MEKISSEWTEYFIIDSGDGEKLEDWNGIKVVRPDPQAIWRKTLKDKVWKDVHAKYFRSEKGGGNWQIYKQMPEEWNINYKNLTFNIKPMGFKHMGLFPEQGCNWDWVINKIQKSAKPFKVLNLFAYTGGATIAAAYAGATEIVHVDASKGMNAIAKKNAALSGLSDVKIRYIADDVFKFVEREIRRQNTYQGIILDPPSYGRGPKGEIWKISEGLSELLSLIKKLLSSNFSFLLLNSYTGGLSHTAISNIIYRECFFDGAEISSGEVLLPVKNSKMFLPCGVYASMERNNER